MSWAGEHLPRLGVSCYSVRDVGTRREPGVA